MTEAQAAVRLFRCRSACRAASIAAAGLIGIDRNGECPPRGREPPPTRRPRSEVDLVVNTHLHVDHVGWNTRLENGRWVPTFPNATYLMPAVEFEYWNPANNPDVLGGVNENVYEDSVAPVRAAGQVQLWKDEHRIDSDLVLEAAPGHTPGSSVVKLVSGSERALFAADLVHNPVQILESDYNSCFCLDPAAARATRRSLLGWAAEHGGLVLPAHFSGAGAVSVARSGPDFAITAWAPFAKL